MHLIPLIMAGGQGVRLWPLSNTTQPKQFLKLNDDLSLFQQTLLRNKDISPETPLIFINQKNLAIALQQIKEISINARLIVEPERKNTTATAIIASLIAPEQNILILPSDHLIHDTAKYNQAIQNLRKNHQEHKISLIGIRPKRATSDFGYIKYNNGISQNIYEVESFIEKPSPEQAQQFIESGSYFWNSGIIYAQGKLLLELTRKLFPEFVKNAKEALDNATYEDDIIYLEPSYFKELNNISIDYALLENTKKALVAEGNFDWNDLGNWDRLLQKTATAQSAENLVYENIDNLSPKKRTKVIGLENIIVINTNEAMIIAHRDYLNQVKQETLILQQEYLSEIAQISEHNLNEAQSNFLNIEQIYNNKRYIINKITLFPGQIYEFNTQKLEHRNILIISGNAKCLISGQQDTIKLGQNIVIAPEQDIIIRPSAQQTLEIMETIMIIPSEPQT